MNKNETAEEIKKLYEGYYERLKKCPVDDREEILFISGQQNALEELAKRLNIHLEKNNLMTLSKEIDKFI